MSDLPDGYRFAWWVRLTGMTAIALPPWGVFIRRSKWERRTDVSKARLIRHEDCHLLQYEHLGFWKTYLGYFWLWVRFGYENHPREIEARAYARGKV